ncbi:MAG: transcription elongation factor GreA [Armatimonas sp.]
MEEELERLITVDRPEVAARIRDAKDYGELAENPEYESAKTAQAFIEGRIMDLKSVLGRARILHRGSGIDGQSSDGSSCRGARLEYSDDWALTLVSAYEADPDEDRISDQSPIGRALMGHRVGDTVTVNTPSGTARYEILGISH